MAVVARNLFFFDQNILDF